MDPLWCTLPYPIIIPTGWAPQSPQPPTPPHPHPPPKAHQQNPIAPLPINPTPYIAPFWVGGKFFFAPTQTTPQQDQPGCKKLKLLIKFPLRDRDLVLRFPPVIKKNYTQILKKLKKVIKKKPHNPPNPPLLVL